MKTTIANDTGGTANFGCKSVRRALDLIATDSKLTISASLPVGTWAPSFRRIAGKASTLSKPDHFPKAADTASTLVQLDQWRDLRDESLANDALVRNVIDDADLLIVNGEGSIHHNYRNGLALLAIADAAASRGKRVVLLNATLQAMDEELLKYILPKFAAVQVREPLSLAYIKPLYAGATCAADVAVLDIDRMTFPTGSKRSSRCLISAGILADRPTVTALLRAAKSAGLNPTYLSIGKAEAAIATPVCEAHGAEHVTAESVGDLPGLLSQFEVSISGRHHLNLFLMRAGIPFVPLPSNTWKIEGTLNYLQHPASLCSRISELEDRLAHLRDTRQDFIDSGQDAFARAAATLADTRGRNLRCD
jgi:hypothetical protein